MPTHSICEGLQCICYIHAPLCPSREESVFTYKRALLQRKMPRLERGAVFGVRVVVLASAVGAPASALRAYWPCAKASQSMIRRIFPYSSLEMLLAGAENVAILGIEKNAHTHPILAVKRLILSLYLSTTASNT